MEAVAWLAVGAAVGAGGAGAAGPAGTTTDGAELAAAATELQGAMLAPTGMSGGTTTDEAESPAAEALSRACCSTSSNSSAEDALAAPVGKGAEVTAGAGWPEMAASAAAARARPCALSASARAVLSSEDDASDSSVASDADALWLDLCAGTVVARASGGCSAGRSRGRTADGLGRREGAPRARALLGMRAPLGG